MTNSFKNGKAWRILTNFWTLVVFMAVIYNFFNNDAFHDVISPLLVIYVALLAIYAGDKEFERWHDLHTGRHPGELFVILWTILIAGFIAFNFITGKNYKISGEVLSSYIAVLSVLAITRRSKLIYNKKRNK